MFSIAERPASVSTCRTGTSSGSADRSIPVQPETSASAPLVADMLAVFGVFRVRGGVGLGQDRGQHGEHHHTRRPCAAAAARTAATRGASSAGVGPDRNTHSAWRAAKRPGRAARPRPDTAPACAAATAPPGGSRRASHAPGVPHRAHPVRPGEHTRPPGPAPPRHPPSCLPTACRRLACSRRPRRSGSSCAPLGAGARARAALSR